MTVHNNSDTVQCHCCPNTAEGMRACEVCRQATCEARYAKARTAIAKAEGRAS